MKFLLKLLLILFAIVIIYDKLTRFLINKYNFNLVIGKPSAGKSIMYCKLAYRAFRDGRHVYGTEPITVMVKDKKTRKVVPCTVRKIDPTHIYTYRFPKDSLILIDEMGTYFHGRSYKEFGKQNIKWWKTYRHWQVEIWGFSQSFDVDKVLRLLVTQFWIAERFARAWTICRRLIMKPVVVHPQGEAPASIQDDFVEDPRLLRPVLGGLMVNFIPAWINAYDTFKLDDDQLALIEHDYSDDPVPYIPYQIYRRRWDKVRNLSMKCIDKCQYIWYYNLARINQICRRLLPWKRK